VKPRELASEPVETAPHRKAAIDDDAKKHRIQNASQRDRAAGLRTAAHRRALLKLRMATVMPPTSAAAATP